MGRESLAKPHMSGVGAYARATSTMPHADLRAPGRMLLRAPYEMPVCAYARPRSSTNSSGIPPREILHLRPKSVLSRRFLRPEAHFCALFLVTLFAAQGPPRAQRVPLSGTNSAIRLRAPYAKSGTDLAVAAGRWMGARHFPLVPPPYLPARLLYDVPYRIEYAAIGLRHTATPSLCDVRY
eukprot:1810003-Rhodomonas_salina.3